jgi:hypothetical protein
MRWKFLLRFVLVSCICVAGALATASQAPAQGRRANPRPTPLPTPKPSPTPERTSPPEAPPEPSPEPEVQDVDTLKIATDLVTVPVIATTREGNYIPDLLQEEFGISENGVKQEVAFFATVSAPFHVVLMLDTSGSTKEKLSLIREAAIAFVDQLQKGDQVKVISFDDRVRELNEFTSDRTELRNSINKTMSGKGTKLYDAFDIALSSLRPIKGRKAIVLFSDGVDAQSDDATFDKTLHWLDEEAVLVYPIRYDTRADTARLIREQSEEQGPILPTIDVIRRPSPGTTAPTFPSDDPDAVKVPGQTSSTGPFGLPSASEIMRRRRKAEREREERERERRDRDTGRYPDGYPTPDRDPDRDIKPRSSDPRDIGSEPVRGEDRALTDMLDPLYKTADSYLQELANKSGGRVLRADTLGSLPAAFAKIAAELRTQYAIGYYPLNKSRDGSYRKIKVTTTRKNVSVRARPGYRSPSGG